MANMERGLVNLFETGKTGGFSGLKVLEKNNCKCCNCNNSDELAEMLLGNRFEKFFMEFGS